jgi:hypothetical protein
MSDIEKMQRATRELGLAINVQLFGRRQDGKAESELRLMLAEAYAKRAGIDAAIKAAEAALPFASADFKRTAGNRD